MHPGQSSVPAISLETSRERGFRKRHEMIVTVDRIEVIATAWSNNIYRGLKTDMTFMYDEIYAPRLFWYSSTGNIVLL